MTALAATLASVVRPRIILGTMPFGDRVDEDGTADLLKLFADTHTGETRGKWELDTARMYVHGKTEEVLGSVLSRDGFRTK